MKWPSWWPSWLPWLPPSRGDLRAILFGIVLVLVVGAAFIVWPIREWRPVGFGPDWHCFYLPRSDPVCIKKN